MKIVKSVTLFLAILFVLPVSVSATSGIEPATTSTFLVRYSNIAKFGVFDTCIFEYTIPEGETRYEVPQKLGLHPSLAPYASSHDTLCFIKEPICNEDFTFEWYKGCIPDEQPVKNNIEKPSDDEVLLATLTEEVRLLKETLRLLLVLMSLK